MLFSDGIKETGLFDVYNDGSRMPIVCYTLKENAEYKDGTKVEWNLYDLEDRLMMNGWQVPAYPMPEDVGGTIIQRIVCRVDLTYNLAEAFVENLNKCIEELKNAHVLCNEEKSGAYGFTH